MSRKSLICLNQFTSDVAMSDWLTWRAEVSGVGKAALLRAMVRTCMARWPQPGTRPPEEATEGVLYGRIGFTPDAEMFNRLSDLARQKGTPSLGAVAKELVREQLKLKRPTKGRPLVEVKKFELFED